MQNGDFYGYKTGILSNQHLRMEYLLEAGPRIVRLSLADQPEAPNFLKEAPDIHWDTPYGQFNIFGGHRLWHAPESFPRTYIPDNQGQTVEAYDGGVCLWGAVEPDSHIQKSLEINLNPDRPEFNIIHRLENKGAWPVELSAWGITQFPMGGVALLPQPSVPVDSAVLLPNRHISLWPYTSWSDERLVLGEGLAMLRGRPIMPPCKVGYANTHGWVTYLRNDIILIKRFNPHPNLPHPDFGCNVESYCNNQFIEVETLGPVTRLEPGQVTEMPENWELRRLDRHWDDRIDLEEARSLLHDLKLLM